MSDPSPAARGAFARGWRRLRSAVTGRVAVDARALGALRIALGLLLLADLLRRARFLGAFYTDAGVLPRSMLVERYPTISQLSLHALSGALWWQAVLFVVAGVAALALLAGYRTRLATLVSLLLLVSLQARNPLVLNAGDSLLRRLLIWGLFLPLGARWSVDARRPGWDPPDRVVSVASAALLIQVVLVYAVNAVVKLRTDVWLSGRAVRYALSLEQFTILLGEVIPDYPQVVVALGTVWLGLVVASPLLLALRGRPRGLLAGAFVGMHAGMALSMRLGLFPFISIAALLAFFPAGVWDRLETGIDAARGHDWGRRVERALPLDRAAAWSAPVDPDRGDRIEALVGAGRRLGTGFVALLLVGALVWNAAGLGLVALPDVGGVDPADNRWEMFAYPPQSDGWYVATGETSTGERVDLFGASADRWRDPPDVSATYPSSRWRKYLENVRWAGDVALQRQFAEWLCHRYEARHGGDLRSVTVSYVRQPTRFEGPEPVERVELVQRDCPE